MRFEQWLLILVYTGFCAASLVGAFYSRNQVAFYVGLVGTMGWSMIFGWIFINEFNRMMRRRKRSKA